MIYWFIVALAAILVLLVFVKRRFYAGKKLTVLMYHKISSGGEKDYLTVPAKELEKQFRWLLREQYTPILLHELVQYIDQQVPLPEKPVLITFDDGYRDNYTNLYPLLSRYGIKANIFLVPTFLLQEQEQIEKEKRKAKEAANTGESVTVHTPFAIHHPADDRKSQTTNEHLSTNIKERKEKYLRPDDIHSMDAGLVEFGLHSLSHRNFKKLSDEELRDDLAQSKTLLHDLGISFQPCLAFPFGAFPKHPLRLPKFLKTLSDQGIVAGFRIGNRLNPLPLKNPLVMQRLDIRGEDSLEAFTRKVRRN